MTYLHWKNDMKHCILLKTTTEIPIFLIKEVCEQTAAFSYYKYYYFLRDQQMSSPKNILPCRQIYSWFSCFIFQLIVCKICAKNSSNVFSLLQSWIKI